MSTDYFSDYQSFVSKPMPSPADTFYETPPLSRSRRSSRRSTLRGSSNSPPPMPSSTSDTSKNGEGHIFGMDPKRFTPTLHASLVSEILTLRRELENKHRFIDNLETNFESVKAENDILTSQLAQSAKESRLAEQRFKTLENGTLDAVEDIVRERDDAKNASAELRTKLEALNKVSRKQEEDSIRAEQLWGTQKQSWENERRQLERRIHVTESRLRAVVEMMSVHQTSVQVQEQALENETEDSYFKDSGLGNDSDTGSIRSYRQDKHTRHRSNVSNWSIPVSLGSPKKGTTSLNLADELGFEEEDEYDLDHFDNDDELFAENRLGRCSSNRSSLQSVSKAKKILGIADASTDVGTKSTSQLSQPHSPRPGSSFPTAARSSVHRSGGSPVYVDTGVQPASPVASFTRDGEIGVFTHGPRIKNNPWSLDADAANANYAGLHNVESSGPSLATGQQKSAPLSPPETPIVLTSSEGVELDSITTTLIKPAYKNCSTQTEVVVSPPELSGLALRRSTALDALPIPSISIHPPLSAPTSPGSPRLPPGMADASAQTDCVLAVQTRDASMQTEEIRIDKRPVKLPPHLLPSTLESALDLIHPRHAPALPETIESQSPQNFVEGSHRHNSEKLPLKTFDLPRPALFAAKHRPDSFTLGSSNAVTNSVHQLQSPFGSSADWHDAFDAGDEHPSDMFGTTPGLARYGIRSVFNGPPKTVPEDREISPAHFPPGGIIKSARTESSSSDATRPISSRGQASSSSRSSRGVTRFLSRSPSPTSRESSSRGTSSHAVKPPPFPIPSRSSSRVRGATASERTSSPTPLDTHTLSSQGSDRDMYLARKRGLRKVQSSSPMRLNTRTSPRRRRRAPDLTPIQSMAFDDGLPFELPKSRDTNQVPFSPVTDEDAIRSKDASIANDATAEEESKDAETAIVDSIAATMVGEWLWKYVRRRKSFTIGEATPGDDGMNGTRHKRWVWLSPYERTIMWSSKQPNSGIALLGKTGRKLTIKSVLDVKDDTPLPKSGMTDTPCDRSILILTPERALKFTAPNLERHYLWLTALSFLAQSGRGPPQIPRLPLKPVEEKRKSTLGVRFAATRDSVRHTQGRLSRNKAKNSPPMPSLGEGVQSTSRSEPAPALLQSSDVAEPPNIARVRGHRRNRSNSNPASPRPSIPTKTDLRSFSSSAISDATVTGASVRPSSKQSSMYKQRLGSMNSLPRSGSGHSSVASPVQPNLFEAVSSMQMDAFVDRNYHDGVLYVPAAPPSLLKSGASGRNRGESGTSTLTYTSEERRGKGYVYDEEGRDPFKGF